MDIEISNNNKKKNHYGSQMVCMANLCG